jgi:TRAP-type C4-dicarboxylate transport system permease large subunit
MKTCHCPFRVAESVTVAHRASVADRMTPPLGAVLFVVGGVTRVPMRELVKSARPLIALM